MCVCVYVRTHAHAYTSKVFNPIEKYMVGSVEIKIQLTRFSSARIPDMSLAPDQVSEITPLISDNKKYSYTA